MKKLSDNEFLSAEEFSDPPKEYAAPPEQISGGKEFGQSVGPGANENNETALHRHLKKGLLLFAAGSVVCTSVMLTSFGSLFFGGSSPFVPPAPSASVIDTTATGKPTGSVTPGTTSAIPSITATSESVTSITNTSAAQTSTTQTSTLQTSAASTTVATSAATTTLPVSGERADSAFPVLSNLEPNGYINDDYGVLDEEYICLERNGTYDYLVFHEKEGQTLIGADGQPVKAVSVDGMSYSKEENALYLRNYHGGNLYINLMGNGFKIHLIGDNSLDLIVAYGFFYGGSVLITGEGSLTVNKETNFPSGFIIECEQSDSCLMVDGGATFEVYGSDCALLVKDSTMDKGIYYLSPLVLEGGVRSAAEASADFEGSYNYSIKDENGNYAKYVKFSK